jgi:3-hydroxyisobutyrate dehydrogenase-like beta-hydroxyacid dehydrogenase
VSQSDKNVNVGQLAAHTLQINQPQPPIATILRAEAVGKASVVLLMLSDAAAIQGVLLDDAAVKSQLPGRTMLMMSTIGESSCRRFTSN